MTSPTPDRSIGGLTKRAGEPDLSNMLARNRPAGGQPAAEPTPAPEKKAEKTESRRTRKTAATPAKKASPRRSAPASAAADSPKPPVTTYMNADVRNRARAAFKATAHLEGDRNWSAYVEGAVLAETERREQEYNDGEPFPGGDTALSPGRPLS